MKISDSDFSPSREYGIPTPNDRQWVELDHVMRERLGKVVEDLERDPLEYLDRFKEFAQTLKGAPAAAVMSGAAHELGKIRAHRKRARRYVEQISDEEINEAFKDTYAIPGEYNREQVYRFACGIIGSDYRWRIERLEDHDMFFNAWNFAVEHGATLFTGDLDKEKLPSPLPPHIEALHEKVHRTRYSRKKDLGNAQKEFSNTVWQLRQNIGKSDRLFANRFLLMWNLTTTRALHKELNAQLTKPLEDYARWWKSGYGNKDNWEYKHKGADATWRAQKRIEDYEEELEDINKLIDGPGPSVGLLVEEVTNTYGILKIFMAGDDQDSQKRRAATQEAKDSQEKRLGERVELAKEYIEVPTVFVDELFWIDHRALFEGLKGRTSITKSYGHSYVRLLGIEVDTAFLKKWIGLAMQDPATGKRISKKKWTQDNWAHLNIVDLAKPGELSQPALFFIAPCGNMRISTTLYDQSDYVEITAEGGHRPVINMVDLKEVAATSPITRQVWTPEDIETYHPVLA